MQAAVAANLARGGSHYLVTLTMPHDQGDDLVPLLRAVSASYRRVQNGRWADLRKALGIIGSIRALEFTYGASGWHPHLHVLVFTAQELGARDLVRLRVHYRDRWHAGIVAAGYRAPSARYGVRVDHVGDVAQVADYICKAVVEVARSDMKQGRSGGRSPWEVLADLEATGVDPHIWREYEEATFGRRAIEWSRGLRAALGLVDEVETDEEIAASEVGGEVVGVVHSDAWALVLARRDGPSLVLCLVEHLGAAGLPAALALLGASGDDEVGTWWRDYRAPPADSVVARRVIEHMAGRSV